ncbi:YfbR-like 5'-deoxynucleotidase [Desulfurivibrio sp. D14AmB]|uniref:YfbR-like 5'-deoxynucleotidase n=1 Tax=Desulfurivibrio sp. D14AmB TaxID=3374370 RepID=UPI00376F2E1A
MNKETTKQKKQTSQPTLDMRDIARSGHVTRWHSVRTGRDQTLAEHHYMVAMIVNHLAGRIFGDGITPDQRLTLMEYALWHDAPELLMGDLPSPLKRRVEQLCPGSANPLAQIEQQIAPGIVSLREKLQEFPPGMILIKLADLMDGVHFISQEGIGHHAKQVCLQLRAQFIDTVNRAVGEYPKYPWPVAKELLDQMENGAGNQVAFEGVSLKTFAY